MKLTPVKLQAIYAALALHDPLKGRVPPAHKATFHVTRGKAMMGSYEQDCCGPEITISSEYHKTLAEVMETMAHEMCHIACERAGDEHHWNHGAQFNALAAKVCDELGFKFPTF